jgi:molybdate transport system substrate-binding protein
MNRLFAALTVALGLFAPTAAHAADIKVLCALGMKEVIDDLGPKFERASGHKLAVRFGTLGEVVKLVQGGELADVVIVPRQGLDTLVKEGKASADAVATLATSGIYVVVRQGAPKPDISSPDAFRRALLSARSITYANPADGGAGAIHFAKVLERLGIDREMKAKTIYAGAFTDTGLKVANGTAELGVQQLQVLIPVPGIEVVGPLPGDLQAATVFASAVMPAAKDPAGSRAFIDFLRTPEARNLMKAKGLDPT